MWLTTQIETSKSPEEIENEVHSWLEEAKAIMKHVENSWNEELIHKFNKEYQDIRDVMWQSLEVDKAFSISERTRIKLELSDLLTLADENEISDKISRGKEIVNKAQWVDKKSINRIKEDSHRLTNTPIKDLTDRECIWALMYLNHNYSTITNRNYTWDEDTINNLSNKAQVQDFQEKLINKIIWEWNNFWNGFIKGFSEKRWFYLKTEIEISQKYTNFLQKNPNPIILNNYLEYLLEKNWWEQEELVKDLNKTYWSEKAIQILLKSNIDKTDNENSFLWSILSSAIDVANLTTTNSELIEDFNEYWSKISDPIIKKYINEELNKLNSGGEVNDWSILLHSYTKNIEYWMSDTFWLQKVHNYAQDSMINNLLWNNHWFNWEYIKWYNSDLSNYIIKTKDFEQILQTSPVSEWNSLALSNYFLSIWSQWKLNNQFLTTTFWKDKIIELWNMWSTDSKNPQENIARKKLETFWLQDFIQNITLFEDIFSKPELLNSKLSNLNPKQLEWFWEIIDQNLYSLWSKFRTLLLEKMNGIENPEEKVNELILKLRTQKGFNIVKEIKLWREKYELDNVELKETTEFYQKICDWESQKNLIDKYEQLTIAKEQNNTDEVKILESEISDIEIKIVNNSNFSKQIVVLNENELNTIANKLIEWENIDIILKKIAKDNIEFNNVFNEIEENENKILNNTTKKENDTNTYNDSLTYNNYSLDKDTENPSIETQDWQKIPIDKEEAEMVENNPDIMENIVNFYKFFTELNLLSAWELRTPLALAMWVSNINLHDDWLKESELIAYGNKLLQVMNNLHPQSNKLNTHNDTISSLKANFNEYTWTKSILSANKTHGLQWEDKFKYDLRMYGIYTQNHWIQISNFREQTKKEA